MIQEAWWRPPPPSWLEVQSGDRCRICRDGGPSCQFQAASAWILSFHGQASPDKHTSCITAGRFMHLDPKPRLLANYLDMLIACLISPQGLQSPPHTPGTLPITAGGYQGPLSWCSYSALCNLGRLIDPLNCCCNPPRLAPAYLCLSVPLGWILLPRRLGWCPLWYRGHSLSPQPLSDTYGWPR